MTKTMHGTEPEVSVSPWFVREEDFPSIGPAASKLRFLLQYAVLAPSSHNSQPWRFRVEGDHAEVYVDRSRATKGEDPDERGLITSCGAAIEFLRIALRYFGYRDRTDWHPDPGNPDFLARVEIAGAYRTTEGDRRAFRAIPGRRTSRQPFDTRPLPGAFLASLAEEAERAGAHLVVTQDSATKGAIAGLVAEADSTHSRFAGAKRWNEHNGTPVLSRMARKFHLGGSRAATDRALAEASPALATLWTSGDTPFHWLVAGQALARVLLGAQASGVSASYLNQPIEVPALRPLLRQTLGLAGYPQILLRLGFGPSLPPTPRRPVEETMR